MDINALAHQAATTQTGAGAGGAAISSDFETFLKMLTVQMENQDPLNPVDSSDYAVQLATFSQVEQSVMTNDLLKNLSSQFTTSGMAQMAAWVGKEARAPVAGYFDGSPVTVATNPVRTADRAELVVTDSAGREVQRRDIPTTADAYEWAGTAPDGSPLARGAYAFSVVSYANGEVVNESPAEVYATISEVRIEAGQTMLIFEGGSAALASNVTALRSPD